jgi:hypothetical protein
MDLNTLIEYFDEYEEITIEQRAQIELERDYYDNKQYTSEEIKLLEERKQPVITFNLIKRSIDAILGTEQQSRTDPKAFPRTPQHEGDAEAITDALRYVADNNDSDQLFSDSFFHLLIEGTTGIEVSVQVKRDQYEILLYCEEWDRMFYDPHARKKDFSDSKYYGYTRWMDLIDAKDKWPDAAEVLESSFQSDNAYNDTFEDVPRTTWTSKQGNRKRLRINQIWFRDKKGWNHAIYTKAGFIQKPELSPYIDENGEPESSMVMGSAYIDRDGNRYGYVRQLISPQDEVNKRRSKALHLISQRQTFGNKLTGLDAASVKRELAKPDGHVQMQEGEFGRDFGIIPTTDMAQGNFNLLQEAKEMFNSIGPNTSVSGTEDRVRSGRAELARQQAGIRELTPVLDMHRNIKRRVYRKIWNRIKQYWTEERWIRVTDNEQNVKFVGLNAPITVGDQLKQEFGGIPKEYARDPRLNVVVGRRNDVSQLDVDIILEESPDYANIQAEQFEMISSLFSANPNVIPFDALIELSSLRNKKALLERIKGNEEQQAIAAQKQQQAEQIQVAGAMAEIEKTRSEAEKNDALAYKATAEAFNKMQERQA